MTPEEQRIAIAEFCGWRHDYDTIQLKAVWISPKSGYAYEVEDGFIPDYLNDLNAMHEAEKILKHPEAYASRLGPILLRDLSASGMDGTTKWHFAFTHATAAQRAEALLRTVGRWED